MSKLETKAKTFIDWENWVMQPSEWRSDPLGGAYDTKLTENRREIKLISLMEAQKLEAKIDAANKIIKEWFSDDATLTLDRKDSYPSQLLKCLSQEENKTK
jgi:hypothetical protein